MIYSQHKLRNPDKHGMEHIKIIPLKSSFSFKKAVWAIYNLAYNEQTNAYTSNAIKFLNRPGHRSV